jgi:5,5'-dehydrodivanillate O-demethylase
MVNFLPDPEGRTLPQPEDPPVEYWDTDLLPNGEYNLTTFHAQDKMAWETQGELFDRSQEHLGATDRGIVLFRKLLAEQITIVEQGGEPIALVRDPAQNEIIRFASGVPVLAD